MKQRLADYVADFLVKNGITDCFMITGGGAIVAAKIKCEKSQNKTQKIQKSYQINEIPNKNLAFSSKNLQFY